MTHSQNPESELVTHDVPCGESEMTVCTTELTQSELDEIRKCESVVIREYERVDGSRYGHLVSWGDADEMDDVANIHAIVIVRNGDRAIGQTAVRVRDLLGPEEDAK